MPWADVNAGLAGRYAQNRKAQLAPGFPTIRDLELLNYITTTAVQLRSWASRGKKPSRFSLRRGDVKRKEWPGHDCVGNHHVKISLALHTLNRLMRHLPESGSGLHVHDLFLLAVIAWQLFGRAGVWGRATSCFRDFRNDKTSLRATRPSQFGQATHWNERAI